jgi:selenocysteine lyase/cysteine desulfurase
MRTLETMVGNEAIFPILGKRDFFNHAGASPWPRPAIDAMNQCIEDWGTLTYLGEGWFDRIGKLREALARLIGSDVEEVSIQRNTSDAISMVAGGLDLRAGDRIVTAGCEYPSNVYPWVNAAERVGASVELVPEDRDSDGRAFVNEDRLIEACERGQTRVLAISHVQWTSGQRMNLDRLGSFCRDRDIFFCVDGIQSLGVVPLDVSRTPVDAVCSGGHKWLMSPLGAGLLYVRRDWIERLRPSSVGWASVERPLDWSIKWKLQGSAERFESGTHNLVGLIGMLESVRLLNELGIDRIHERVRGLCERFECGVNREMFDSAERVNAGRGRGKLKWLTPSERWRAGGASCFEIEGDPEKFVTAVDREDRIHLAARMGRVRFSPHFYNTEAQIDRAARAIGRRLAGG